MEYYLGIDAGGSKTLAYITNEHGQLLGQGLAGGGNHQTAGLLAGEQIGSAIEQALQQTGIQREQLTSSCFGLAGADRPADYAILHPMIRSLGFAKYDLVGDTLIGLRAGTTQPYGIAVICGTGTNSAGIHPSGESYQCGGFDYKYGDFGGGGSLCIEVFRSVIRAWDGREHPTVLTELLLDMLNYRDVETLFHDYLDHDYNVPLRAAELLFTAAAWGDGVALDILTKQGQEIGKSITAIIHRLAMHTLTFDVVMIGSLLTRGDRGWIRPQIEQALQQSAPHASLVKLEVEPVIGAILRAMEQAGRYITPQVYTQLHDIGRLNTAPGTERSIQS